MNTSTPAPTQLIETDSKSLTVLEQTIMELPLLLKQQPLLHRCEAPIWVTILWKKIKPR